MGYTSFLHFPRPRSFLYLMSLQTGTELITLTLLINKVSGLYGILALLTGLQLSPLQLSMYIYSILALVLAAILAPHIRKQTPFQCLALAWFYLFDSIINAIYTAAFSLAWFLVLAQHNSPLDAGARTSAGANGKAPGGTMMDDAAGFTNPTHNVSEVEVVANPISGSVGQDAALIGHASDGTSSQQAGGALETTFLQSGSLASMSVITFLWLVRLYFILIVMAYARAVLRQHIVNSSHTNYQMPSSGSEKLAGSPFAVGREEGQGWKGKLGRVMVRVGRGYWLGADDDGELVKDIGNRFGRVSTAESARPYERERRRRAGTGPSKLPPVEMKKVGQAG